MTSFINLDLDKPIHWKFLIKHILFSLIWLLSFSIFIFRFDLYFLKLLQPEYEWLIKTIPIVFIITVIILMYKTKWYYNLALIFYPAIIIFWFLPKLILHKGKIYLLSNYISFVYNRLKKIKRTLTQIGIFTITIFVLIITDSNIIRICSMLIMTFFYYKYLVFYINSSFKPAQLFGPTIENAIDKFLNSPDKKLDLVKSIEENNKKDEKLSEKERNLKKLKSFITFSFLIETFGNNLNGFKGKKAFIISWLYQLLLFLLISISFFTFLNFELFVVDASNFTVTGNPNLFDFIYYTIKTVVFENSNNIVPLSPLAKIIEIFTFFTLGIFLFVLVTSIIFTMKQDRINENVKKANDLCIYQNQAIAEHIKIKYQTDIQTVLNETANIKKSLENIKKAVEKLF